MLIKVGNEKRNPQKIIQNPNNSNSLTCSRIVTADVSTAAAASPPSSGRRVHTLSFVVTNYRVWMGGCGWAGVDGCRGTRWLSRWVWAVVCVWIVGMDGSGFKSVERLWERERERERERTEWVRVNWEVFQMKNQCSHARTDVGVTTRLFTHLGETGFPS